MLYKSITPNELKSILESGKNIKFIDVREQWEHEIASVNGAELLPLTKFGEWVAGLKTEDEIIVMCHHGIRSANVCTFLVSNGFENVYNLEGGMDLWSLDVDQNVPRY